MRRVISTLAAAAVATVILHARQQTAPRATGAISGTIVDAVTAEVMPGSVVSLSCIACRATLPPRVITDSKGRFIFAGLAPADDYYLTARHIGYQAGMYGGSGPIEAVFFNEVVRLRLAPDQWIPDLKIQLWKLPSISGRVIDERGEPMVGVAVRAFSIATVAGHEQLVGGPIGTTDDRGTYRLIGLSPGRYMVSALSVQSTTLATAEETAPQRAVGAIYGSSEGISAGSGSAISAPTVDVDGRHRLAITNFGTPPPPSAGSAQAYAAQFFPAVRSWREAEPIELQYGQVRGAVDFQMQPVAAFRVSGKTQGSNSPGLLLRLMPVGSESLGFGSEAATTAIEQDGSFTFLSVPSGNYTLVAQSAVVDVTTGSASIRLPHAPGFPAAGAAIGGWDGAPGTSYLANPGAAPAAWGRAPVAVGGQSIDDLHLTLRPLVRISGRIAFAQGTAEPVGAVRFWLTTEPANGDPLLVGKSQNLVEVTDGVYRFGLSVVAGVHLIRSVNGYRVVSITSGGRDVTYSGVDVSDAEDESDVVVTVTDKRIGLSGKITGLSGKPAGVILFPVDRQRWTNYGWQAAGFRTTRAGSDGAFELTNVVAGEYFVVAVETTAVDRWTDQKFLTAASGVATRIVLAWGDTKTIDVPWREFAK